MLKILIYVIIANQIATDTIIKDGLNLQLRIDTHHANVLELGRSDSGETLVYTRLAYGDERIEVTCVKTNCLEDGTLAALVNSNAATRSRPCTTYYGNWTTEYKCLRQTFAYTLYRNDMSGLYHIECRVDEFVGVEVDFQIVKLFVDNHPRLRTGSKLHHHNSILFYKLNNSTTPLTCECIQDLSPARSADQLIGRFNRLGWFVYETSESLNLTTTTTSIVGLTKYVFNYSSVFAPAEPEKLALNIAYKCCTMMNDEMVNCQAIFYIH